MKKPSLPNFSDAPEVQADWLEWAALSSPPGFVSWTSYQRDLNVAGSVDALDTDEEDEDIVEGQESEDLLEDIVNDISRELRLRSEACGGAEGVYPYRSSHEGVAYEPNDVSLTYRFLLLLSLFGKDAGPKGSHPERLFEDLCALALQRYLGDDQVGLSSVVFGFPRPVLPKHFPNAVDELCRHLGEGGGGAGRPSKEDQKDAKLDLVAWRAFPDGRRGKLVGFAQCATGEDWTDKSFELQPEKWCKLWMQDCAGLDPFGSIFIPHRPVEDLWVAACNYGGVLFDRCRISWLVPDPNRQLGEKLQAWADHVEQTQNPQ
jgi:hypothetical protein